MTLEPKEADDIEYNHKWGSGPMNELKGMYVFASRTTQWMDKVAGTAPEEGDELKIEFEDGSWADYKVDEVIHNLQVLYKDRDKYEIRCHRIEDDDDYPESVLIGMKSANYAH